MPFSNHETLLSAIIEEYTRRFPRSAVRQQRALPFLIDGGSHTLRLFEPFPFRIDRAEGAWVYSIDGHRLLDFWQGHYTNILGHNPELIRRALSECLEAGYGLQTGIPDELELETAELLARQTGAERVRFTTSGSLATMYAIMLSRVFTGRQLVLKAGGGWHGGHPWGLKGVKYGAAGYDHLESEGLPVSVDGEIRITRYNDPACLEDQFRRFGDRIACFIVEPWVGMGGFIPAMPEYLRLARQLTEKHGAVLIFDEIITGFRFRAGNLSQMYGVQPDLITLGKVIGGGMPVAAVVGRACVMDLCGKAAGRRVKFDGGTYSGHPLCLVAAKAMIGYLVEKEKEIYPRLAELGEKARRGIEEAFARHGIAARCTGYGNQAVPGSSLVMIHFPINPEAPLLRPEDVWDPERCDVVLREQVLKLGFLLNDVHVVHGLGALSTAHTEADLEHLLRACSNVAERIHAGR